MIKYLKNLFKKREYKDSYTIEVTQEIINNSDVTDHLNCIGANTLKTILHPKTKDEVAWGITRGHIHSRKKHVYKSYDLSDKIIDMTEIKIPTTVVFKKI